MNTLDVYCDEEWTVIQRRMDGSESFKRGWKDYKDGFGALSGEFWLGNDKIHHLTKTPTVLLVELKNALGEEAFALYNLFQVGSSAERYQLKVGSFMGTAGDALQSLNGSLFSAFDSDNDDEGYIDCADVRNSAWWYKKCSRPVEFSVDLNGLYSAGILWKGWSENSRIKSVTMKIKPKRGKQLFFLEIVLLLT